MVSLKARGVIIGGICLLTMLIPCSLLARTIILNGVDVSSARNQTLKNVDLQIDDKGNIIISAPQYQVNEENTYIPLAKYVQGMSVPQHKFPGELSSDKSVVGQTANPGVVGSVEETKLPPVTPTEKLNEPPAGNVTPEPAPPPSAQGVAPEQKQEDKQGSKKTN